MDKDLLNVSGYSIMGDRGSQQDAYLFEKNDKGILLASVCDGMGGMEGGERASACGIQTIFEKFRQVAPSSIEDAADWIKETLIQADKNVSGLSKSDGTPLGGGSTCVMVMADNEAMQWGSVGDSSIYFIRNGIIQSVNKMHNYNLLLDDMVQKGEIDLEERNRRSIKGEALVSFLGIGGLPVLDTGADPICWQQGDIIILCSDGIYKSLDKQQILAIVEESGNNMQLVSARLCTEAYRLKTKSQDNTTVVAIRYGRL